MPVAVAPTTPSFPQALATHTAVLAVKKANSEAGRSWYLVSKLHTGSSDLPLRAYGHPQKQVL